jgi:hypothetical protein
MIIAFALVLLITGMGIMFSLYSLFLPFIQDLGDIKGYNVAYYGAVSSLERAHLVLRYQDGGFEGSGGWLGNLQK